MQTPLPGIPPQPLPGAVYFSLPRGVIYRGSSIPGFNAWKNPLRKTQHLSSRLLESYLP